MSSEPDPPSQADLERRRVPLERKVSLKFKEFRGFITEVSHNVSLGGMFIATASPKPPGTIFDFELSLTDDFKLVQGIGEVVWVREHDEGAGRPPGMGVRFLDLSPESRRLIQRIVEEHVGHGGVPFDLEPAPFPPPPLRTAAQQPAAPPPVFHPTAAPMAPPPPAVRRPAAPAPAVGSSPLGTPSSDERVTPDSRTASLPRERALPPFDPAGEAPHELPDLQAPELPVPELQELLRERRPAAPPGAAAPRPEAPSFTPADPLAGRSEAGELLPPVDDAWTAPPRSVSSEPARPSSRVADGVAEVARAFGTPASGEPRELDDTVRLARFAPPDVAARTRSDPPVPAPLTAAAAANVTTPPAPPSAAPLRRRAERRRSRWPLAAALVVLLGAAGVVAALYLRFPALLPAWAPGAPPVPQMAEGPRGVDPRRATPEELQERDARLAAAAGVAGPAAEAAPPAVAASPAGAAGPTTALDPEPEPEAPAPSSARFSVLDEIWGQRNAAGTLVTLVADGAVPRDSFTHAHLDGGKPREVLYLRGVAARFERAAVPVGTPEVVQVRTGYHVKAAGNELHVVVDLAAPDVRLLRAVAVDNRIELQFGR